MSLKKINLVLVLIIVLALVLRVYKLSDFAPGLYSDETAYGYNAYSLLKTGHDEFGEFWPVSFKSFGDYKPAMSAWLTIPSVLIFGLNEFAVRIPVALAGSATVLVVYFLAKEVFLIGNKKNARLYYFNLLPYSAATLLAISPWHLMFSRSSMLVGFEVMFTSAALLFFLRGLKNTNFWYLSAFCFTGAIYSYYGARVTTLLILLSILVIFKKEVLQKKREVFKGLVLALLLLSPLVWSIVHDPLTLTGRAKTVSIFFDPGIKSKLWEAHTLDGQNYPVILSRFFHNKTYFYFRDFARRYLEHFSFSFLFLNGDSHPPFFIPRMGVAYLADLLFFLYGLFLAVKVRNKRITLILTYLFIGPIVASLTFLTPAANRSFNLVIAWTMLTGLGIVRILYLVTNRKLITKATIGLIIAVYLVSLVYYLKIYYFVIPKEATVEWHYGRRELVGKIAKIQDKYEEVVISGSQGTAYIWLLFYQKYDPVKYRQTAVIDDVPDGLGWIQVRAFDKYKIERPFNWNNVSKKTNTLYVSFEDDIPSNWVGVVDGKKLEAFEVNKVLYPAGGNAFKLIELKAI